MGQGYNDITMDLKVRFEIQREFPPCIGASWKQKIGKTAALAEDVGEDTEITAFVAGIRFWL